MRQRYVLVAIAAILLVSFLMPSEVYAPPQNEYHDRNYDVYRGAPIRTATVLCKSETREYYQYLVNWSLRYPHDVFYSRSGIARTTILIKNWSAFKSSLPFSCEILSSGIISPEKEKYSPLEVLYNVSILLKNMTAGTADYEKLKPFFIYASTYSSPPRYPSPRTNNSLADVMIITTDLKEVNGRPFAALWGLVIVLSAFGLTLSRRKKVYLAVFVILLILGAFFVGKFRYLEHERVKWNHNVASALSLEGTDGKCWPLIGVINTPSNSDAGNIPKALRLINETRSRVLGVSFEDYIVKLRVGVSPRNYEELLKRAEETGLEVDAKSESWVLGVINETRRSYEAQEELIGTLEKYLPKLSPSERNAMEGFLEMQKKNIKRSQMNLNASRACYEVDLAIPSRYGTFYYGSLSDSLAVLALLSIGMTLLADWRLRNGKERGDKT